MLELADIAVESLVPAALAKASVDEFLKRLSDFDAPMAERVRQAKKDGQVLRYVADIDVRAGTAAVRLAELRAEPSVREHQPHGQHRAVRDGALLRQSVDRPRPGRRPGRDGGRHLRGSAAPLQHAERPAGLSRAEDSREGGTQCVTSAPAAAKKSA